MLVFADVLLPVIQQIINLSLLSVTVSGAFKKTVVKKNVLKKSSLGPDILGNYRPVSNVSYLSNLLERAVADQLLAHLDRNKVKVKFQSAYRSGHGNETALLRILNDLLTVVDGGNNALLYTVDLSAAFDTNDHALPLQRLRDDIGRDKQKNGLSWFTLYLTHRSQKVLLKQSFFLETPLLCGVSTTKNIESCCNG